MIYLPEGGELTVDLSAAARQLQVEWIDPVDGSSVAAAPVDGRASGTLKAPRSGGAVVHIWSR